jgi:hypothetical protein
MVVGGEQSATRDFEDPVTARKGLTYVRTVPKVSGNLRERDLRHG